MMSQQHRALIVEDDERNARDLADILQAMSCQTAIARSKEEAMMLLDGELPCVILLDLQIPRHRRGLTDESAVGISLLEEIRRRSGSRLRSQTWIPVIVVSGHAGVADDAVELMKLGADDVIQKPYDAQDVAEKVAEALKTSGRTLHADCVPVSQTTSGLCVIEIPGTGQKFRTIVRIAGQETTLGPGSLSVLLRLLIGRALEKPVPLSAFGGERRTVQRLRDDLGKVVAEPTKFIIVRQGTYSLPQSVSIGAVETGRLVALENQTITDLSRELDVARERTGGDAHYASTCWALLSFSRPIGVHDSVGPIR